MGYTSCRAQFSDNEVVGLLSRAYAKQWAYLCMFSPNLGRPPGVFWLGGLHHFVRDSMLVF